MQVDGSWVLLASVVSALDEVEVERNGCWR